MKFKLLLIQIIALGCALTASAATLKTQQFPTSDFFRRLGTNETSADVKSALGVGVSTNGGTVTSVGIAVPPPFTASGPVTDNGTITIGLPNQAANSVWSGPSSGGIGAPSFRLLVPGDVPSLDGSKIGSGIIDPSHLGAGADLATFLRRDGFWVTPTVPLIGNGIGITNLSLAHATSSGSISSNGFDKLQISQADNGFWRSKPPLMIDSFYHYGTVWTSANISNELTSASSTNGGNPSLRSLWDIWYILDDGWQGGITNGILMPNLGKLNITNICAHAHANGVKLLLYVEPTASLSSDGFPTLGTNWQANARAWATWGIDGLKIDMTAGDPNDFADKITLFSELVAEARKGFVKPLAIFTGGWRDQVNASPGQTNAWLDQVTEIANATRIVSDNLSGWQEFCTNYVVDVYERNSALNKRGHWLHLDHVGDFDAAAGFRGTNIARGGISTFAMLSLPMSVPLIADNTDPPRYWELSRPDIIKLHSDSLCAPATRIYSNTFGSVWSRPLSWGGKAVMFLNHLTNNLYTTNINWVDIGFNSNQLCGVWDAWNSVLMTNTTGGFSMTVSNESAFVYFIYPTNTLAGLYPTDIPFQNWFQVDAASPTWAENAAAVPVLFFAPASTAKRISFTIPKTLVTTTKLKCVVRVNGNTTGNLKLYWLVGTELNNAFATDGSVFTVPVTSTTPTYFTNTFTVVANPDSCGMRFGLDATSTLIMNVYNITVQAQ